MKNTSFKPDKIGSYFKNQYLELSVITISGLIYNLGLLISPLLEGRMVQCLLDILNHTALPSKMVQLAVFYCTAVAVVQFCRFIKRLYTR